MYCWNIYLRTGLTMPTKGWVVNLGANRGLFSVWAAVTGAQAIAVEAQDGFGPMIRSLAAHNGVADPVHVEIALASGAHVSAATVGVLADTSLWAATSHGALTRPADISVLQLMSTYNIDRIGLLKVGEDLRWLDKVDQVALEIHRHHGDAPSLVNQLQRHGFTIDLRDNDGARMCNL